ncbi:hypothetical protein ACFT5B_10725 [Luteimicrobium sp. NPDC057192]|uniref:hypothetical protein n=1 Tax=Luteimicrobium sp. NPDC057192 TaxID=3346042 RepID=UPI0036265C14
MSAAGNVTAVRGHAVSFKDDPFHSDDALVDIADALVVSEDGVITAFGPYDETRRTSRRASRSRTCRAR